MALLKFLATPFGDMNQSTLARCHKDFYNCNLQWFVIS